MTTNERSLFGCMRPVHGTLDACDQSAVWRSLSYVTRTLCLNIYLICYVLGHFTGKNGIKTSDFRDLLLEGAIFRVGT